MGLTILKILLFIIALPNIVFGLILLVIVAVYSLLIFGYIITAVMISIINKLKKWL